MGNQVIKTNQNEGPTEIATWSLLEAISVDWFKGNSAENI
jgi:hypothetical protein